MYICDKVYDHIIIDVECGLVWFDPFLDEAVKSSQSTKTINMLIYKDQFSHIEEEKIIQTFWKKWWYSYNHYNLYSRWLEHLTLRIVQKNEEIQSNLDEFRIRIQQISLVWDEWHQLQIIAGSDEHRHWFDVVRLTGQRMIWIESSTDGEIAIEELGNVC